MGKTVCFLGSLYFFVGSTSPPDSGQRCQVQCKIYHKDHKEIRLNLGWDLILSRSKANRCRNNPNSEFHPSHGIFSDWTHGLRAIFSTTPPPKKKKTMISIVWDWSLTSLLIQDFYRGQRYLLAKTTTKEMGEGIMTGSTSFLDSNFKAEFFHQEFPFDVQEFCPIESGKNWASIFCSTWKCRWNEPFEIFHLLKIYKTEKKTFLRPILGHLGRRVSQFLPVFRLGLDHQKVLV